MLRMTHEEWLVEAKKRFGDDPKDWVFVCPVCRTHQTIRDFLEAGLKKEQINKVVGFSCIGRVNGNMKPFLKGKSEKGKGCDWSLGGLLSLHNVEVEQEGKFCPVFEFADSPEVPA